MPHTELLFSYGTLQLPEVQLATFGRHLDGRPAAIAGYSSSELVITDLEVIARSGSDRHPVLRPAAPDARIAGTVYEISATDLAAADDYEVDDYVRVTVRLDTGEQAWVYVFAEDPGVTSE
ncbi:gamma-glutamylcyclotransferase [Rhodococcus sp. D2-41]|uniref:Gamma-glutamylcyclotransferase n=1 Tax=Speluncibacter jeojiensis TaxID=2710754 RepID=A0A9X4LZU2_9ACTN|nr:gamma-glutamylcyclotransferase family protein [Rhodococcus sp. D2-41]MDG3009661.1 gamma-glutamylcyclotransferase [Rhodococcus sp. D2-41]MDG3014410.1 gamma-glutamylcyclotransferase [Corynebacteriales bacterium D3-21]